MNQDQKKEKSARKVNFVKVQNYIFDEGDLKCNLNQETSFKIK